MGPYHCRKVITYLSFFFIRYNLALTCRIFKHFIRNWAVFEVCLYFSPFSMYKNHCMFYNAGSGSPWRFQKHKFLFFWQYFLLQLLLLTFWLSPMSLIVVKEKQLEINVLKKVISVFEEQKRKTSGKKEAISCAYGCFVKFICC